MNKNIKIVAIQIGDNIHHHDQSIYSVNFNTIKTTVNNPVNPIPLLLLVDFDILFNFKLMIILKY